MVNISYQIITSNKMNSNLKGIERLLKISTICIGLSSICAAGTTFLRYQEFKNKKNINLININKNRELEEM